MFAASDFYVSALRKGTSKDARWGEQGFNIDYVERSHTFRNWLHHFTEHVNYYCPTQTPWWVPFHHGSFHDFSGLEFNSIRYNVGYDKGGYASRRAVRVIRRFDLIIFSNFLTTKSQVQSFRIELDACARFLRHNGVLVIVGAPNRSRKYREVYAEISNIILQGRYSNKKLVADCAAVEIPDPIMKYSWSDSYGAQVKDAIAGPYGQLLRVASEHIPIEAKSKLDQAILPGYACDIEWQVLVFRKSARPRK